MVIIQAFGSGFVSGRWQEGGFIRPNEILARISGEFRQQGELAVFSADVPMEGYLDNICLRVEEGKYLSTLGVFRGAKEIASRKAEREIRVLAAPQHLGRCMRDARRVFQNEGGFSVTPIKFKGYSARDFYCRRSTQWWTRNPRAWWFGIGEEFPWFRPWRAEFFIRLVPWKVYQKIAG